ncbi:hypothetical protein [Ralstonia solanacearum]|uniref:Rad50/SbcC-type AAA domain-containing protein n=1 Tax=Ralstonia solanacearum TaxID=305 RepID=A0AAE3NJS5_RALSL|nr:hypothetical protein [Ralstonia solanacearum]MBB6580161.1 hypothetical protein [Ralstonia solanacearum]MDB0523275.1 hypothetical protein [Ralstonia solanacearum]
MLRIRKILLRGNGVDDSYVEFDSGANIIAGESDTGKSYLVRCLDYIFGAEKLKKHLKEAVSYTHLFVELENSEQSFLTLERHLTGGNLFAHRTKIEDIKAAGEEISPVRKGKSKGPDVTSVVFPFCNIKEARLRKNVRGETQRLSIRTLAPIFLVDEVSIIDEHSPITGRPGFDDTARKRMLSFLLSGKDDEGIVAAEKDEVVRARLKAKLEVVEDLLRPLDERFATSDRDTPADPTSEYDELIGNLTKELEAVRFATAVLHGNSRAATKRSVHADSQLLGVSEILSKYHLLNERYRSDLERLDFLAEGSHYFDSLQEVPCPLCEQKMAHGHTETNAPVDGQSVRRAASAEAAKIHAYRADLEIAIGSLELRRDELTEEKREADAALGELQETLAWTFAPMLKDTTERLEVLIGLRGVEEAERVERERWLSLLELRESIEASLAERGQTKQEWDALPSEPLRGLCAEIETVLTEWHWQGTPHVAFDEKEFDIVVDGQARQSHGKGVRAVLYAAFVIGLLRFCAANRLPHPGVVIIDSPLTSYKKKAAKEVSGSDEPIDAGVEAGFWHSLTSVPKDVQIIVIENKEPPTSVGDEVHYEWFAGEYANTGERAALIPAVAAQT